MIVLLPGSPSSKLHNAACGNGRTLTLQAQQAVWQRESTLTARRRADAAGSRLVCTARKTHSSCLHFASSSNVVPLPLSDQMYSNSSMQQNPVLHTDSKMNASSSKQWHCVYQFCSKDSSFSKCDRLFVAVLYILQVELVVLSYV